MWVLIGLGIGLVAAVIAVVAVRNARNRSPGEPLGSGLPSTQWIAVGFAFIGAGIALMTTAGPAMIGVTAVGVVYLALGMRARRTDGE